MKRKTIATILCCSFLIVLLLGGCFPFSLVSNLMQTNTNGGSDGPTSIVVSSESPSQVATESDAKTGVDLSGTTWYEYENETSFWSFENTKAYLYSSTDDYFMADYVLYYDDDAVYYIADELADYGVTREEQERLIDARKDSGYLHYFCLNFTNVAIYEDYQYTGMASVENAPYYGFILQKDGVYYYDMCAMNSASTGAFYSYTLNSEAGNSTPTPPEIISLLCSTLKIM